MTSMLYAGEPGSPPFGTELYDASGRKLERVRAFNPVTGEVIDHRSFAWLRWLHPGWELRKRFWRWMDTRGVSVWGEPQCRHHFVPAPIRVVKPDAYLSEEALEAHRRSGEARRPLDQVMRDLNLEALEELMKAVEEAP